MSTKVRASTVSLTQDEKNEADRIGKSVTELARIGLAIEVAKFEQQQQLAAEAAASLDQDALRALRASVIADFVAAEKAAKAAKAAAKA